MSDECGRAAGDGHVHVHVHVSDAQGLIVRSQPGEASVEALVAILRQNENDASHERALFDQHRVQTVNPVFLPGSGKTRRRDATIEALGDRYRIGVIEGDLETEKDTARIRAKGVPAIQITSGQTCQLDARMVNDALHDLSLDDLDIVFIENVGKLVCPAGFELVQHANVTSLSVTEGDDKLAKYPVMFRGSDFVVLTKSDLQALLDDFDTARAESHVSALVSPAAVLTPSARKAIGLQPWFDCIEQGVAARKSAVAAPRHHHHGAVS